MKRSLIPFLLCAIVLFGACKSEKKITKYSGIFTEKPLTIFLAPLQDNAPRKGNTYQKDIAFNNEIGTAAVYLYQTLPSALTNQGYYVIGPESSEQIIASTEHNFKHLRDMDISEYSTRFGIDAILLTTIHRWMDKNGEWTVFLEYQLRSTKSNSDLLHTWVKATKQIPLNTKGDPVALHSDQTFARKMNLDNGSAQRCLLVEKVNDYVLRNLPLSASSSRYEKDRYIHANDAFFTYYFTIDGQIEIEKSGLEAFEQECFVE